MLVLDDPTTWPTDVKKELKSPSVTKLFQDHEFFCQIKNDSVIQSLCAKIEARAVQEGIAGYHCTKAISENYFKRCGLRVTDIVKQQQFVQEILQTNQPPATAEQIRYTKRVHKKWRQGEDTRTGKLWFCLTRHAALDGTKEFFTYFGGEVSYNPILWPDGETSREDIVWIFKHTGKPVVVEVKLYPAQLTHVSEPHIGGALVCHAANQTNPNFYRSGLEGYVMQDIPKKDIVAVHSYQRFVKSLKR